MAMREFKGVYFILKFFALSFGLTLKLIICKAVLR